MPSFRIDVRVVPRRGILDPQGKTVAEALHALGFASVVDVRVGRHVVLEVSAGDPADARAQAVAACERLLANPVTEDYVVEQVAEQPAAAAAA